MRQSSVPKQCAKAVCQSSVPKQCISVPRSARGRSSFPISCKLRSEIVLSLLEQFFQTLQLDHPGTKWPRDSAKSFDSHQTPTEICSLFLKICLKRNQQNRPSDFSACSILLQLRSMRSVPNSKCAQHMGKMYPGWNIRGAPVPPHFISTNLGPYPGLLQNEQPPSKTPNYKMKTQGPGAST